MRVLFDIETKPIPPEGHESLDTVWCVATKEVDSDDEPKLWTNPYFFNQYAKNVEQWIAHNGLSFDVPVLNRLWGTGIVPETIIDTFVVSRLVCYSSFSTHSLDEIGTRLGHPKTQFNEFGHWSPEMGEYCKADVEVGHAVFKHYQRFIDDPDWQEALRLEHDSVIINEAITSRGFKFNSEEAARLLAPIKERMAILEAGFQDDWPPQLVEYKRLKYRVTKEDTLFAPVQAAIDSHEKTELDADTGELVCYKPKEFNPGSTKDRVEKLWECGWQPWDKSKTHIEFSRVKPGDRWRKAVLTPKLYKEKKEYFDFYGWKVSEDNLQTLPEDAPDSARNLAEWLTLEGRRSSLEEWLGQVRADGRIHPKFWFIGAWTHRMSHSNPNCANIASPFHGNPRNAVEEVKKEYDAKLRALWCVDDGVTLVGTDADGIQLRILAHYLKNDDYVHAIVSGRKEDETDIHNLNKRALGQVCTGRDAAKTFIYAWLLGAGTGRVASILQCPHKEARGAMDNFLENTVGLRDLKRGQILRDAKRGFFVGVDGRKVLCNSEHLMLAGYLQNAEAIIMRRARRLWHQWATEAKIEYAQVNDVHDEWQTECFGSQDMCEHLGLLQRQSIEQVGKDLNLYCPLAGSTDYGKNWLETH